MSREAPTGAPIATAPVTFESALTPRGYRGVMLHLAARMLRFAPALVAIGGVVAYGSGARTTGFALFAALLAIPIVVWGYVSWLVNSPSAAPLYAPVSWEFSEAGIRFTSGQGAGEITWDSVMRWRTAAEHLMLYVSGSNYLLVPLEAIPDACRDTLRALLVAGAGRPPRRDDLS